MANPPTQEDPRRSSFAVREAGELARLALDIARKIAEVLGKKDPLSLLLVGVLCLLSCISLIALPLAIWSRSLLSVLVDFLLMAGVVLIGALMYGAFHYQVTPTVRRHSRQSLSVLLAALVIAAGAWRLSSTTRADLTFSFYYGLFLAEDGPGINSLMSSVEK